jgi:cobalt/nickel transport system permease protein
MSHVHLPDGVLLVWLWVFGWVVVGALFLLFRGYYKKMELTKQVPLAAMTGAFMVIAMSIELPISYHLSLSSVAGIILGPVWMLPVSFTVNLILATFGHGGITVIGLNTIILMTEGTVGYLGFKVLSKAMRNMVVCGFIVTVISMILSTLLAIGIVTVGGSTAQFSPGRFMVPVLLLGSVGWILEGVISGLLLGYLSKVRPALIGR